MDMAPPNAIPDDLLINASDEIRIRQDLVLTALGHRPADRALRVGRLLDVHAGPGARTRRSSFKGRRIAWVGPAGSYPGEVRERVHEPNLAAVPGFGEVHKHIESSHLTPEWEAALVHAARQYLDLRGQPRILQRQRPNNLEFWLEARRRGSPLKIFPQPGSAVPPTAYEWGGGYFGDDEQAAFHGREPDGHRARRGDGLAGGLESGEPILQAALGHDRSDLRGARRGRGPCRGLRDLADDQRFRRRRACLRPRNADAGGDLGQADARPVHRARASTRCRRSSAGCWRRASPTGRRSRSRPTTAAPRTRSKLGATDHNVRLAIEAGLAPEIAIQCVTINPARHMRLTPYVGVSSRRDVSPTSCCSTDVSDAHDRQGLGRRRAGLGGRDVTSACVPQIDWPDWATKTVNIKRDRSRRRISRIKAAPGRATMQGRGASARSTGIRISTPWSCRCATARCSATREREHHQVRHCRSLLRRRRRSRRCSGAAADRARRTRRSPARWRTTSTTSGSSAPRDAAMAKAVNTLVEQQGGWALVREGELAATVRFEIGGLMSCRPAEALDADMQALYAEGRKVDWMYEPTFRPRWYPGFPERLMFATLTCAPWSWVLVAPCEQAP